MPFFFILFILTMGLLHWYIYRRFIKRCLICQERKTLFRNFLIINFLGVILYILARAFALPAIFYTIGSLSLGLIFVFTISTFIFELLRLAQWSIPHHPKRRDFFKKSGDYGVLAFAASYTTTATIENLQDPVLKSVKLDQKLLNKPIKIVQISDLHISRSMDEAFVERIVTRINALEADIIAITGDLVDAKVTDIQASIDWLGKLSAKQGTYFVTGNHEYYVNTQEILGYLDAMGIQIMDNKNTFIEALGINLVGLPDLHAGQFATQDNAIFAMDIPKATNKLKKDAPTLLLAHQPKAIEFLEDFKPHLTLSGHTHGGQLFPFNYLVRLAQPYVKDLHQFDKESFIYVSSGTGFWGPPMRLGVPSEITLIQWS